MLSKFILFRYLPMVILFIAGVPILESFPDDIQPSSEWFKYLVLPFIASVLIPASKRLVDSFIDRVFQFNNKEPKNESTEEKSDQTPAGVE